MRPRKKNPDKRSRAKRALQSKPRMAKKTLLALLLLLLLSIAPIYVNNAIGYVPVLAYLLLLVICALYPKVTANALEFDLLSSSRSCVRGSNAKIFIRFCNRSPLICPKIDATMSVTDIFGEEDSSSRFSFSLDAKSQRDFNFGASFAHIGTIAVQVKDVVVYDPFGFFYRKLDDSVEFQIEVLPCLHSIDPSLTRQLRLQETAEAPTPFNRDGMEYAGVREYEYGDPIKSIHWKLSSHADELYTRLFDAVGEPSLSVLCGTTFEQSDAQTMMSLYDAELETALSICAFCQENGLRATLAFNAQHDSTVVMSASQYSDSRNVVEEFPTPGAVPTDTLPELIRQSINNKASGNMVVCTSVLSDELLETLASVSANGQHAILFYILPEGLDSSERDTLQAPLRRLENTSVAFYALQSAEELEKIAYE